ncbi:MAG TPA: PRC-barrel domain-containing protein [Azospirillaceae bacterium]|nr:PRC-barrel domain-containing protein [Azospirillaceae bacterium]
MKRLLPWLAAAAVLSLSAASAKTAFPAYPSEWWAPLGAQERVLLLSAADLLGHPVRDRRNRTVGAIAYLATDARTGDISFALVGSGDRLVPVPWALIEEREADGALRLASDGDGLRRAPAVTEARLGELTRTALLIQVYDHYRVPSAQRRLQAKSAEVPLLLVGRSAITTLPLSTARGAEVVKADGRSLGAVERMMIDPALGRVAFVLVGFGGFVGLGEDWLPVPFSALRWHPGRAFFTLNLDPTRLTAMPTFAKEEPAMLVSVSDLRALYNRYSVPPYWRRG